MRDTTERPEAVEAGTVRLVGTDKDAVHKAAYELLSNAEAYKLMSNSVNPYGDGKASERIIQALRHEFLGNPNRPERFGNNMDKDLVKALDHGNISGGHTGLLYRRFYLARL